ncbi:hypothetical protein [Actinocatenispora comari]|uniref:Uncharacterized protein n=1 Tax=Actinocatenispora comari TaxID=2807577 RepID=A0A8J4AIU3_9ACTN|nr:hypothetical protein [Actinocatenispora comari]GIL32056.1 hypothetical protein NUM_73100 [Actinocatenispora comari]
MTTPQTQTLPAPADTVDAAEPWTVLNLYRQALADGAERQATRWLGLSTQLRTDGTDEQLLADVNTLLADGELADRAARHEVAYRTWLRAGLPAGEKPPPVRHMPPLTAAGMPALLELHRHQDVSHVSGAGPVAFVAIFPEIPSEQGPVMLRWRGHLSNAWSTTLYSRPDQLRLHFHQGATTAVWMFRPGWVDQLTDEGWQLLREIPFR